MAGSLVELSVVEVVRMRATHVQRSFADLEFELQGIELDPVLKQISDFLDRHGPLVELVHRDLVRGLKRARTGRGGLGAVQVLRAFVLWRIKDWPYRELRERIADGYTLRQFTRFGSGKVAKADAFQRSFARLRPETVRQLNQAVLAALIKLGLEDARQLRVDTMVVETNIHYPTDSTLLWDGVRVLSRLVREGLAPHVPEAVRDFPNRTRRARRRMQTIARMRDRQGKRQRAWRRQYADLIAVTEEVVGHARAAARAAGATAVADPLRQLVIDALRAQIAHYATLTERVIAQTRRRVFAGRDGGGRGQTVLALRAAYRFDQTRQGPQAGGVRSQGLSGRESARLPDRLRCPRRESGGQRSGRALARRTSAAVCSAPRSVCRRSRL